MSLSRFIGHLRQLSGSELARQFVHLVAAIGVSQQPQNNSGLLLAPDKANHLLIGYTVHHPVFSQNPVHYDVSIRFRATVCTGLSNHEDQRHDGIHISAARH
jgi:hypothetical protein